MFSGATSFNGDLSKWDVSSVTTMYGMFWGAASFNCDISKWDVSRVTKMDYMFQGAASFKTNLCEPQWVFSEASKTNMYTDLHGAPPRQECREYVARRPLIERELKITSAAISTQGIASANKMTCPKCGTFKKSGRASCCAPGGAWYRNCGGAGNRNAKHRWFEGVESCKCKSKAKPHVDRSSRRPRSDSFRIFLYLCLDQCLNIHNSSHDDANQFGMPQMWHHREIWEN